MSTKVNCLECISFFLGLNDAWVDSSSRNSLSQCTFKKVHIREPIRYCKRFSKIRAKNLPNALRYKRLELDHVAKMLNQIEQRYKENADNGE